MKLDRRRLLILAALTVLIISMIMTGVLVGGHGVKLELLVVIGVAYFGVMMSTGPRRSWGIYGSKLTFVTFGAVVITSAWSEVFAGPHYGPWVRTIGYTVVFGVYVVKLGLKRLMGAWRSYLLAGLVIAATVVAVLWANVLRSQTSEINAAATGVCLATVCAMIALHMTPKQPNELDEPANADDEQVPRLFPTTVLSPGVHRAPRP